MPNDSIRAGRCSGPRWIQTLSTSMRPPRSPSSDQRRPAAIAASPLHHVTSPTSRSSRNGARTSIRIRRTNQRCSGRPHPVSWTSSIATSCRNRATASSRRRPVSSMSASRTRRRAANVRPTGGSGSEGSSISAPAARTARRARGRVVAEAGVHLGGLDDRARRRDEPVEARGRVEARRSGPAPASPAAIALDRGEMAARGVEVERRRRAPRAAPRRAASARRGSRAAGRRR